MRWYSVFIKGIKEQIRDFWILIMTVAMAPIFIAIYFLMEETEALEYNIIVVNQDRGVGQGGLKINLGDSLVSYSQLLSGTSGISMLKYDPGRQREDAIELLRKRQADVLVVIPENLTESVLDTIHQDETTAQIELVGDVAQMDYIIGAVWTEELINRYVMKTAGIHLPIRWNT